MPRHRTLTLAFAGFALCAAHTANAQQLTARQAANALAGHWEGTFQVRNDNDQLSASEVSMAAVRQNAGQTLEIYYEGYAFGKPADGAMILSLDGDQPSLSVRSNASRNAQSFTKATEEDGALVMSSADASARAVFSRESRDTWTIQLERLDEDGGWMHVMALQLDRMDAGQRSAAADRFESARPLQALRRDRAIASVPTD